MDHTRQPHFERTDWLCKGPLAPHIGLTERGYALQNSRAGSEGQIRGRHGRESPCRRDKHDRSLVAENRKISAVISASRPAVSPATLRKSRIIRVREQPRDSRRFLPRNLTAPTTATT
jgi:hypothetical protein